MSCWLCANSPLKEGIGPNEWICMQCNEMYYNCERCERSEEAVCYDWAGEDKGEWCQSCCKHFCASCWQNTGTLTEDDIYTCEQCAEERKINTAR